MEYCIEDLPAKRGILSASRDLDGYVASEKSNSAVGPSQGLLTTLTPYTEIVALTAVTEGRMLVVTPIRKYL